MILGAPVAPDVIDDLLGWTVVVGSRFFPEEVLRKVFDKELDMLKDWPEVQRWIEEGKQAGVERGSLATARQICKRTLTDRFGALSRESEAFLDLRTADELAELVVRSNKVNDLAALGVPS